MKFTILKGVNEMGFGIYIIKNLINDKIYIGSSYNKKIGIKSRFNYHTCCLKNDKHDNQYLQRAFNKYGSNSFEFICVMNCAADKVLVLEQYFLDTLKSYHRKIGYNIMKVTDIKSQDNPHSKKHKEDNGRYLYPLKPYDIVDPKGNRHKGDDFKSFIATQNVNFNIYKLQKRQIKHYQGWMNYDDYIKGEQPKRILKSHPHRASYDILSPEGKRFQGENVSLFCSDKGLDFSAMCKVIRGLHKQHKGWAKYIEVFNG